MPTNKKMKASTVPSDSKRIVIDPITRIEGHLKIETEISNGQVVNAWSSGTLYRGIETILQGREPTDAWLFTQRLCGVCTYVHGASSVRSVEDALNLNIPPNARTIRNLLMGGQYVHDHPVHFYHLHALDWVDVVDALDADIAITQNLAANISPDASSVDFADVKARLQSFIDSGQLGPFAGGYWGHPAYILTPEENLLFAAHYISALRQQVKAANMHAIFGAKNPHLQSLKVGGVTCKYDITAQRIAEFRNLLDDMRNFIDTVYLPDVTYLATRYREWAAYGGFGNYMSFGEFPSGNNEPEDFFFERGVIFGKDIEHVQEVDLNQISEDVRHSWYAGSSLHPSEGATNPNFTGYNTSDEYSWLKAPRYQSEPMEVGPLARILVAYGKNNALIKTAVDEFLFATDLTIDDLHSTLGRTAARALETKVIADEMDGWLDQLVEGAGNRVTVTMPLQAGGAGLNEAPRGALGHWIAIDNKKIENYQMVVPSTWNLGPRCSAGKEGPVEAALVGTPVDDSSMPLEILRTVHSFDPCMACAVHVIDKEADRVYEIKVT